MNPALPVGLAVFFAAVACVVSLLTIRAVIWRDGKMWGRVETLVEGLKENFEAGTRVLAKTQERLERTEERLGDQGRLIAETAATLKAVVGQVDRIEQRLGEGGHRRGSR